jgi:hypothetical protein
MNTSKRLLVVVLVMSVVLGLYGCGSNPPHYGAFLKEGGQLVEMKGSTDRPDPNATEGIPTTNDKKPTIIMWLQNANLNYLNLANITSDSQVQFNTNPTKNGIWEIQPEEDLSNGLYCFTPGDPSMPFGLIPNYCFRVGSNDANSPTAIGSDNGNSPALPSQEVNGYGGKGIFLTQVDGSKWLLISPNSYLGKPDSSRLGYRVAGVYFFIINKTDTVFGPSAFNNALGTVIINISDTTNGDTYQLGTLKKVTQLDGYVNLPPNYGVLFENVGEVPNKISIPVVNMTFNSVSTQFPLYNGEVNKCEYSSDCNNYYFPQNSDYFPLTENLSKGLPGIGGSQKVGDVAEVTLKSASFNQKNWHWDLKMNVKNIGGYDITGAGIYLSIFNDSELTNFNDPMSNVSIPPDMDTDITYSIPSTNNLVMPTQLIIEILQSPNISYSAFLLK